MLFLQLAICQLLLFTSQHQTTNKTNLTIDIQNIKSLTGQMNVAIFRPCDKFPDCRPLDGKRVDVRNSRLQVAFEVEPGEYAVAVYHDLNNNGKLDTKLFGIPKEPFGFSNNYRPIVSAPTFDDCRITIGSTDKTISIKLL